MAVFNAAYRMTVYGPRSVDRNENTVLTPASGAIHTDAFQVASVSGLTGYKAYLDGKSLRGRKSRWDSRQGVLDSPAMSVTLLDQKVTGFSDNLHRWITAFVGDGNGVIKLTGCRVTIEESLDWNSSTPVFTNTAIGIDGNWQNSAYTASANATAGPDGLTNATRIQAPSGVGGYIRAVVTGLQPSTNYVASWYIKNNGGNNPWYKVNGHPSDSPSIIGHTSASITTAWTQVTVPFTTQPSGDGSTSVYVYVENDQTNGNADFYAADFAVTPGANVGTWSAFYAGRIDSVSNLGLLQFAFQLREGATDDLKANVFNASPSLSASNATRALIWPVGLSDTYGNVSGSFTGANLRGIQVTVNSGTTSGSTFTPNVILAVERGFISTNISTNLVTQKLLETLPSTQIKLNDGASIIDDVAYARSHLSLPNTSINHPHRIRIKDITSGSFVSELELIGVVYSQTRFPNTLTHMLARAVAPTDPAFISASVGSSGPFFPFNFPTGQYNACVLSGNNDAVDDTNPLFINDTHPAIVMRDVLLGYYTTRYTDGRTAKPIYVKDSPDNANDKDCFSALIADKSFGVFRGKITAAMTVTDFFSKYVVPFGIGYRVEARYVSGTIQSVVAPFDNRLPTSASLVVPTISTGIVAKPGDTKWSTGVPIQILRATYYLDNQIAPAALSGPTYRDKNNSTPPTVDAALMQEVPQVYQELIADQLADTYNAGGRKVELDFKAVRGEFGGNPFLHPVVFDGGAAVGQMVKMYAEYTNRFARGPASVTLSTMRTGSLASASVGRWVSVDVDVLPNPSTHLRGGSRIMQVTERTEMGPVIQFGLLDSSQNAATSAPTVTALTSSAAMSKNNFWAVVTIPSNNLKLQSQYALTASGSTRPAATSSLWTTATSSFYPSASNYTASFHGMPANTQVYTRFRTETDGRFGAVMTLPSDWVFPSGNGYWLTDSLAAPTNLHFSSMTVNAVHLSWSTGSDNWLGVYVASPTSSTSLLVRRLEPNTTAMDLGGLSTSSLYNPMRVELTQLDPQGGQSPSASVVFTLSGSVPFIPVPRGIRVNP